MAGMLKGERTCFDEQMFPFKGAIRWDTVVDQMHFVLDASLLDTEFRTLGSLKQGGRSLSSIMVLTHVAEAVGNMLRHRGRFHGKNYARGEPRIQVILTYATREVWNGAVERPPLQEDALFEHSNIVALVFSVLVMDEDLSLGDALSDQFLINAVGLPEFKPSSERMIDNVEALVRQQNPPLPGNNNDGDGDGDGGHNDGGGQPPQHPAVGRPDVPNRSLTDMRSVWQFHRELPEKDRHRNWHSQRLEHLHYRLTRFEKWVKVTRIGGFYYKLPIGELLSDPHMGELPVDHLYRPDNYFSLEVAMGRLEQLGAHDIFLHRKNWINQNRADFAPGQGDTFGAPCWPAGQQVFVEQDKFENAQPQYTAGCTLTSALIDLDHFTAERLVIDCLPHCTIIDRHMLRPDSIAKREPYKAKVLAPDAGARNRDGDPDDEGFFDRVVRAEGEEIEFNLDDMLESLGVLTAAAQSERRADAAIKRDIFNHYHERYAPLAARLNEMLVNTPDGQVPGPYVEMLQQLRDQGFRAFYSAMELSNTELPLGYRALLNARLTGCEWVPIANHVWLDEAHALTPFAQQRVRQIILFETVVRTSDTMLLLLGQLLRAVYTIYLPRSGTHQNKEHVQMVCGPGTSKSDVLNKLIKLLLMPDTYEVQGGSSALGAIGNAASERLLEVFHELSNRLAPKSDPRSEDDMMHKMLLTMLSEGEKAYKTVARQTNATGQDSYRTGQTDTVRSEYTSVVLGARNYSHFEGEPGGTAEAMHDRFTEVPVLPLICKERVNIINQLLQTKPSSDSVASARMHDQYVLRQRILMEYGALIAYYAVPMPDLALFSDLAPQAVSFLAVCRPEIYFKLRGVKLLSTRMLQEVISDAMEKAVFSVLNPSAKIVEPEGRHTQKRVELDAYDTRASAVEISRYAYARMDTLIFVLSERMYELTGGQNYAILRSLAERRAHYYTLGHSQRELQSGYRAQVWQSSRPSPPQYNAAEAAAAARANHFYFNTNENLTARQRSEPTLEAYVQSLLKDPTYYLGEPASSEQQRRQTRASLIGVNANEVGYTSRELVPEQVPPNYKELFEMNCSEPETAPCVPQYAPDRVPAYKREYWQNKEWLNPNYVTFKGTIKTFASSVGGRIGNYQLSPNAITDLLYSLSRQTLIAPYLPLIAYDKDTAGIDRGLHRVQSLRYVRNGLTSFPKYRVPVVIHDSGRGEIHLLISYFETDIYSVTQGMVDHISYNATRPCRSILGIGSRTGDLFFEPVEIRPRRGRELKIPGKNNVRPATREILSEYFYDELGVDDDADAVGGQAELLQREGRTYLDEDIEHRHAMAYLQRNFPTETPESLEKYTPRGIDRRLYGAEDGFYTRRFDQRLKSRSYLDAMRERQERRLQEARQQAETPEDMALLERLERMGLDDGGDGSAGDDSDGDGFGFNEDDNYSQPMQGLRQVAAHKHTGGIDNIIAPTGSNPGSTLGGKISHRLGQQAQAQRFLPSSIRQ